MPPAPKRKLGDLFVIGKQVVFNDDSDSDPIVVWVQKLNSAEIDEALTRANAKRAMTEKWAADPESVSYLNQYAEVLNFDNRATLVEILIQEDLIEAKQQFIAQLNTSEKWAGEDDLMAGLVTAWIGDPDNGLVSMQAVYAEGPESENPLYEEAKAIYDQLEAFDREVDELTEAERERLIGDFQDVHDEELRHEVTERLMKRKATTIFVDEFKLACLLGAVRDDTNRKVKYFENTAEILALQDEVKDRLQAEYDALEVSSAEGKGSRATPDSSDSSAAPETPATEGSSTPQAAAQ